MPGGADGALVSPPVRAAHGRLGGGAAPFAAAVGAAAPRVWAARPSKWRLEKQTSAARAKPSASAVRINESTSWLILFTVAFQWEHAAQEGGEEERRGAAVVGAWTARTTVVREEGERRARRRASSRAGAAADERREQHADAAAVGLGHQFDQLLELVEEQHLLRRVALARLGPQREERRQRRHEERRLRAREQYDAAHQRLVVQRERRRDLIDASRRPVERDEHVAEQLAVRGRRRAEAADDRRDELEDRAQPRRRQRLAAEVERGGAELGTQPRPQRRQLAVRPVEQRLQRAELVCCAAETSAPPPVTGADETPAGLTRPRACSAAGASAAGRAVRASTAPSRSGVTDGAAAARAASPRENSGSWSTPASHACTRSSAPSSKNDHAGAQRLEERCVH